MLRDILLKKQRERELEIKRNNAKNIALGATIGTAVGAALGVLFAPKSGKETRDDIANKSVELAENVKDKAMEAKEKAMEIKESAKQALRDAKKEDNEPEPLEESLDEAL